MEKYLIYILAEFLGRINQLLVGFVKNKTIEKANHFKLSYFTLTILITGISRDTTRVFSRQRMVGFFFGRL